LEQKRETILVTDNLCSFRTGVREALSSKGIPHRFKVLECDTGDRGELAIEQIAAKSPDAVLLGIDYSSITTRLELIKKIVHKFPATRVIVLSNNPVEEDDELFEVIKTGAVAYLRSTDCTSGKLSETIKRACKGEYPINDCLLHKPRVAWRVLKQFQEIMSSRETTDTTTTPFTPREIQILNYVAEGKSNKRIASLIGISEQTIKNHVSAILRKLNANDRAHAVIIGLQMGLIHKP